MMIYKTDISHRYFRKDVVVFHQPLLQFRNRSIILVRITKIIDEMDFSQSIRGTNSSWAVTRLIQYYSAVDAS